MREKLLEIGLSDPEAKIYLELLEIGTQGVSVLSKRLKMPRTTIYSVLKNLENKGLVSSRRKSRVIFFSANDPNCLIGYLDRQSRVYANYRLEMLDLIPNFRLLTQRYDCKKPIVSYFEGIEGIKHVMYDALKSKENFFAYLSLDKWLNFKNFKIFEKKRALKVIVPDLLEVRNFLSENYRLGDSQMTEILYVSDKDFVEILRNEMTIHDDRVSILHLKPGEEYGIVIESREIAAMEKKIFEMAWRGFGGIWS